jgi:dolichyl-phosphate-mannose--protein O-mannosyl transferase
MNDTQQTFWVTFGVRTFPIVALATLWLTQGIRNHSHTKVVVAVAFGYVIVPVSTYLYMRYLSRPRADV